MVPLDCEHDQMVPTVRARGHGRCPQCVGNGETAANTGLSLSEDPVAVGWIFGHQLRQPSPSVLAT